MRRGTLVRFRMSAFFLILTAMFPCFSIYAQEPQDPGRSQGSLRAENPVVLGAFAFLEDNDLIFAYNFNSRWSIGIAAWFLKGGTDTGWFGESQKRYASPHGTVFAAFFPFDFVPVYAAIHLGRLSPKITETRIAFPGDGPGAWTEKFVFEQRAGTITAAAIGFRFTLFRNAMLSFEMFQGRTKAPADRRRTVLTPAGTLYPERVQPADKILFLDWMYDRVVSRPEVGRLNFVQAYVGMSF